jgi:hypothetical protein
MCFDNISIKCVDCGRKSPPNCGCIEKWPQNIWEKTTIEWMQSRGWTHDRNDQDYFGFSFVEGEHHWIRDYNKKTRSFVQYDGNQKVNIRVSK